MAMKTDRQYDRKLLNPMMKLAALAFVLAQVATPLMALDKFKIVDYPGSTDTRATGINDAGDTVGNYHDAAQQTHGFLLKQGKFTSLDFPGSKSTNAVTLNNLGDIVGTYTYDDGLQHAYLYSGGQFTKLDMAGATLTG